MRCRTSVLGLGILLAVVMIDPGCSTRASKPTLAADSTLVYPGKKPGDVAASITFCSKVSRKSGKRLGVGRSFEIGQDDRVYAFVDLQNQYARGKSPLSFHLVWLDPDGDTVFKKIVEYAPSDTVTSLSSSLSLPLGKRSPGHYTFRAYLFRELIAEKGVTLKGEPIRLEKPSEGGGEM